MNTLSIASAILIASALAAFSQSQLAPLPPDGFVTLQQIVQDFTNQPVDALQKYNGMRICVYGRIGKVEQSDDDDADPLAVSMQLQNQTTPDVKAYFDQDDIPGVVDVVDDQNKATVYHRDWAGNLSDQKSFLVGGENAAIRGTFDNFVAGDIILKNSFKLSPEALSQKLSEHGISTE